MLARLLVAAVVLDAVQELQDLRRPETTMATERPNGPELAGRCPAADGLGVDPEPLCHLGRREKAVLIVRGLPSA